MMFKGITKLLAAGILLLAASGANAAILPLNVNSLNHVEIGNTYVYTGDTVVTGIGEMFEEWLAIVGAPRDMRVNIAIDPGISAVTGTGYGEMAWGLDFDAGGPPGPGFPTADIVWGLTDPGGNIVPNPVFSFEYILGFMDDPTVIGITGTHLSPLDDYTVLVSVSQVPVPGAAILFGSAVMAFGFISRRRKGITA
ncbi:MAG: hypothetical protein RNU03_00645 [Candidatus Sedimenticola sp. (ex Thyasira tokunagai)]